MESEAKEDEETHLDHHRRSFWVIRFQACLKRFIALSGAYRRLQGFIEFWWEKDPARNSGVIEYPPWSLSPAGAWIQFCVIMGVFSPLVDAHYPRPLMLAL